MNQSGTGDKTLNIEMKNSSFDATKSKGRMGIFICRKVDAKAISMLKDGKAEQEVAEVCGFSDSSAFIKSFKKVYHITPMQYLKQ